MRDVAVIVPCKNYAQFLEEALDSLLAQSLRPTEVLIVDDSSIDASADVARAWLHDHGYPVGWQLLAASGAGVAAAVRQGIAASTSTYVARLDADDRVHPTFLARLVDALELDPAAAYAYPAMQLFGDAHGRYHVLPFDPARLVLEGNFVSACALMRRQCYDRTRGVVDLPAWEDWDLWLSFLDEGMVGTFVDEDLYFWRRHGQTRNKLSQVRRRMLRLRIWGRHPGLLVTHGRAGAIHLWRRARNPIGQQ